MSENNVISAPTELLVGVDMECPKCASKSARYIDDHTGVFLKCLCGLFQLVQSKYADGSVIDHIEIEDMVTLPRKGSKLMSALGALYSLEPANTKEITDLVNIGLLVEATQTNSDVASQLTILRYKGLVEVIDYKRGVAGGSVWKTTDKAKTLMSR